MNSTVMQNLAQGNPVLIAEVGVNYYDIATKMRLSLLDAAKLMIKEAKHAGIHAVKFQSYKATELAAKISPSYWDLREQPISSQRELFTHFDHFGEKEYAELAKFSEEIGIEFFSTAFDYNSADYLDKMMNIYKISSSDLSNIPFIEYQARKNKPVMLSVGASNEDEIDLAVSTIRKYNDQPLTLLHCVLEYPTPIADVNLRKISTLKKRYPDCYIGFSDHSKPTNDCDVIKAAYLLGAQVIEKHYTLDKSLPANDHFHAMDPDDAKRILESFDFMDMLCGSGELVCLPGEKTSRLNARRSLVSGVAIPAGTIITREMLKSKRPGTGISPQRINDIIGKKAKHHIEEDITLQYDMFES